MIVKLIKHIFMKIITKTVDVLSPLDMQGRNLLETRKVRVFFGGDFKHFI